MWYRAVLLFLSFGIATACDAGVFWGEKRDGATSNATAHTIDRSTWPTSMREKTQQPGKNIGVGDSWPAGADATSYSHTLTWEKMDPPMGGNVFVSLTLAEGCGSGYIGAQMHGGTNQMFTDWAIWDVGMTKNTRPANPQHTNCVRYDGEGFGTQCGVPDGHYWEMNVPYTFNVSLVASNASGAHFKGSITNEKSGEVITLGEIWTGVPAEKGDWKCDRLLVGGGGFQEIYSGGNFTNVASVTGPIFRGVTGHPADVMPTGMSDCYMHHSCYGKDGAANCRNETVHHCLRPDCPIPVETFFSGHVPIPDAMIPPWDRHPDIQPSTNCWFEESTMVNGGIEPEYWGVPIMSDKLNNQDQEKMCCGYCLADPNCKGAQLYGDQCHLRHFTKSSSTFTYTKGDAPHRAVAVKGRVPPPPGAAIGAAVVV